MLRSFKNVLNAAVFYCFSCIKNKHIVCGLCYYPHIMGNQHNSRSHFFPKLTHQLQDLCLNGYVQGGGRLICDKKSWLAGYCHGNHHSLAHTA